uniref:Uncharacterized protein n=1 Tax=Glossina pallidipes TaxID=7398 RepID=A0A1A9ZHT7_GLOPL
MWKVNRKENPDELNIEGCSVAHAHAYNSLTIARPTANGADPVISCRFESDTAFTTSTKIAVMKASIDTACPALSEEKLDTPKPLPPSVSGIASWIERILEAKGTTQITKPGISLESSSMTCNSNLQRSLNSNTN